MLWPNGWMDQDAIWQGGRPQPSDIVLDGDPATLTKRGRSPTPTVVPYLLWPNGWMDHDGTDPDAT